MSAETLRETASIPRTNVETERDFGNKGKCLKEDRRGLKKGRK